MPRNAAGYWIGTKPSKGEKWMGMSAATVLAEPSIENAVFRMFRRYVKQWNDIELDRSRSLSEHTHEVHGAQVVGANRQFVLMANTGGRDRWCLEILYARGFSPFHPGASCGKNPFRTMADIHSIRLHWSDAGDQAFYKWLQLEQALNESKGEWTEYKK